MSNENKKKCTGYLISDRVIIPDYECANNIYWNGYYGAFLGVQKPKQRNIMAPLELSLLEAAYLLENEHIKILLHGNSIDLDFFMKTATKLMERFNELYAVYKDLRQRGFIVRRGLKFGCDFLIYRYGPGIDHAPYGVHVYHASEPIDPIEIVRMGRVLHSVRKTLIIAIYRPPMDIKYLALKWWRP